MQKTVVDKQGAAIISKMADDPVKNAKAFRDYCADLIYGSRQHFSSASGVPRSIYIEEKIDAVDPLENPVSLTLRLGLREHVVPRQIEEPVGKDVTRRDKKDLFGDSFLKGVDPRDAHHYTDVIVRRVELDVIGWNKGKAVPIASIHSSPAEDYVPSTASNPAYCLYALAHVQNVLNPELKAKLSEQMNSPDAALMPDARKYMALRELLLNGIVKPQG